MFYFLSGYIFSCLYFGYLKRGQNEYFHGLKLSAAFLLHAAFFLAFMGGSFWSELLPLFLLASIAVFFSNFIGATIQKRLV